MKKTIIIIIVLILVAISLYFHFKVFSENQFIRGFVFKNSAAAVKGMKITDKRVVTDKNGAQWMFFQIEPLPKGVTDPAAGVMRKNKGKWEGIAFGTFGVEDLLPEEVRIEFGL